MFKYLLLSIRSKAMLMLLMSWHDLFAQIQSPISPSFQHFQLLSIQNPRQSQYPVQPQFNQFTPPMGATADDVKTMVEINAMRQMGVQVPQVPPNDPALAAAYIRQQAAMTNQNKQSQQIKELKTILSEDLPPPATPNIPPAQNYYANTLHYRNALSELIEMKKGTKPFSIKRAVFLVENAYNNNTLDYKKFCSQIGNKVALCKKILKEEGIKENNNLGKNYIIQKLFSEKILLYQNDTVISKVYMPYRYDFNDFMGDKDWSNMFVSKLLKTGKGQCHSLPLNYLCIAEGLNAKAYLAFDPEHSYIIFPDNEGHLWNFETTLGCITSDKWVMQSGYINSAAIQNRLYMDTLNQQQLLAHCIADLMMGYTRKFYYDDFVKFGVDNILSLNPNSLSGLIMKADFALLKTKRLMKKESLNTFDEVKPHHQAYNAYMEWQNELTKISDIGYMGMPKDNYKEWLLSLKNEEQKQEQKRLRNTVIGNVKRSK